MRFPHCFIADWSIAIARSRCVVVGMTLQLFAAGAHGAVCINSSTVLSSVLNNTQPLPLTINLVQGTYSLSSIDHTFAAPISIYGGFTANCASQTVDAANTTIDFAGSSLNFSQLHGSPTALIEFDGITMKNMAYLTLISGQYHSIGANDAGSIRISRSRLSGVPGANANYYLVSYGSTDITLKDVVLDHMPGNDPSRCAINFDPQDDGPIYLEGITADLAGITDLCIKAPNSVADIYNSVIWSSDGSAAAIAALKAGQTINIVNTLYRTTSGNPVGQIVNPLHTDPQWNNPALNDYHLKNTSPAVNSGTPIVPNGGLAATDIEGNPRWIGSMPDRGAYESPFNDATNYQVTTTADSGAGSLRDAIIQANSLPNPGVITFAIPGTCPQTIALASALPSIISPIIIDGSTQPGSSKNDAADAFNATLCVLVKPASGTIANGFVVASGATQASLTLRGLGLGGFGQAVLLIGGSNHVIAGNQFGGTVGGIPLPGAGLNAISIGVNASGSLIVGGLNLADRNVIGGASFNGIDVQGTVVSSTDKCQIVNNLIGLAPNGISALPNFTGISLGGSGCSIYSNRIAGNSNDNLWINGGNNNVVQRNILGVAINDSGFIGSAGLRITGGSGNIIGTSATSAINTSFLANTIRYNLAGGVLVVSGSNNSIRSNLVYDNGFSGDGMDIDLGANGATPNDVDDADTGPNNLQNFPWTDLIVHPADDANPLDFVLNAHLNTLPGSYRIDAYFSNRCDNGAFHVTGRGHADAFVGTRSVTVPAGNNLVFSMPVTVPNSLSTGVVSLTATDATGNTSEIGSCAFLSTAQNDRIFANGF